MPMNRYRISERRRCAWWKCSKPFTATRKDEAYCAPECGKSAHLSALHGPRLRLIGAAYRLPVSERPAA